MLRHALPAVIAAVLSSPVAIAQDDADRAGAFYISGFGATLIADENNILFDETGWQASVALGRYFADDRYRLELEATTRRVGLAGLNGVTDASGVFRAYSGFVNAYVHGRPDADWDPYLGAGFGRGRQNYKLSGVADQTDLPVTMDDYSESFVYHAIAGVDLELTPRLSVQTEARYFTLEDKVLNANFGTWNGIERSYQMGVGFRYRFGQ